MKSKAPINIVTLYLQELMIPKVQFSDEGTYICSGEQENGGSPQQVSISVSVGGMQG